MLSRSNSSDNSNNGEKYCTVCDKPNARNNFGALSCNACAAFFRRTLIQGRQYACHCGSSNPDILCMEQRNVRECKFCRFQKCVEAGMQEKAIRSMEVWKWRSDMSKMRGSPQKLKAHEKSGIKIELMDGDEPEPEDIKDIKPVLPLTPLVTKVILPEDLFEADVLRNLLFAEQKMFRIENSRSTISDEAIGRISQMKWTEVVEMQNNLLAKAEEFSLETPACFDGQMLEKQKQFETLWFDILIEEQSPWFETYIRDLLKSIGFAKTLPFFRMLNLQDQCVLLRSQTLPLIDLYMCFYSMQRGSRVITLANGFPLSDTFAFARYRGDPVVWNLAEKVNRHGIIPMLSVAPSREEFAYLLALIFANPAIAGLSSEGQKLLQEESEKYSRGLLRLQQREYGDGMGALRYADTLRLVANSILNAQKHRELVVYLDSVHDKGRFEALLPKSLIPFCTMDGCL